MAMQSIVGRGLLWPGHKMIQINPKTCGFHSLQVHTTLKRTRPQCALSLLRNPPVRYKLILTRNPQRFTAKHEVDKVPKSFELIYNNNMNNYYFFSQCVIYAILIPTSLALLYLLCTNSQDLVERLEKEELDHPYFVAIFGLVISVGMMAFTNAVCRRGVVRMYQHPDTKSYYAVIQKWNMQKKSIEFMDKDCVPKTKPSAASKFLLAGNIQIKGHDVLIRDTDFRSPIYYNQIMGWQLAEKERAAKRTDDVVELYHKKRD